jgi:bla regulator protein blaR1
VGVVDLLLNAYGLQGFQLVGIPAWTSSAHFDVAGTAPRQTALSSASAAGKQKEKNNKLRQTGSFEADAANEPSDLQLMIRAMLADRFRLRTHPDTRNVPIYALTRARSDGRPGARLRQSTRDCSAGGVGAGANKKSAAPSSGHPIECGTRETAGSFSARSVSMAQIVEGISRNVGRMVVDRTGLSGNWDADLTYAPGQLPVRQPRARKGIDKPGFDPNGPSIFTALTEQLGLKLESATGPGEVLVIDSIEKPAED